MQGQATLLTCHQQHTGYNVSIYENKGQRINKTIYTHTHTHIVQNYQHTHRVNNRTHAPLQNKIVTGNIEVTLITTLTKYSALRYLVMP
jgi:ABC-type antimicrobial peptide transport system permease subunit